MKNKSFKIVTTNVTQLFKFNGKDIFEQSFTSFTPRSYIDFLKNLNADILCIQEMLFDNRKGEGAHVDEFAKSLGTNFYRTQVLEESWIFEGKYYGLAIFCKFPIEEYTYQLLPNPGISVIRPNGEKWDMHDKGVQVVNINVNGVSIKILNLHYFPIFLFNKKFRDKECAHSLDAFSKMLNQLEGQCIIAAGDFNNYGENIREFLPDLFTHENIQDVVPEGKTTIVGSDHDTLDHILFSKNSLKANRVDVQKYLSDHFCVAADFEITDSG